MAAGVGSLGRFAEVGSRAFVPEGTAGQAAVGSRAFATEVGNLAFAEVGIAIRAALERATGRALAAVRGSPFEGFTNLGLGIPILKDTVRVAPQLVVHIQDSRCNPVVQYE